MLTAENVVKDPSEARHGRLSRCERGQTLVIVALLMLALMALSALVLDVGNIYIQRRMVQNAADAAALAGARALALGEDASAVETEAIDYAMQRNAASSCVVSVVSTTVMVTASKTFPTYFAPILGIPAATVNATAQGGQLGYPGSWTGGLMPIAVDKNAVSPGRSIQIWDDGKTVDSKSGATAGGDRGWLYFEGPGASTIRNEIEGGGYGGTVKVGDWIDGAPGVKNSCTGAMSIWINHIVICPVYDEYDAKCQGNECGYHIVGFGAFKVTKIVDKGNPKYIEGVFQNYTVGGRTGGTFDTGVRVIGLKR